MTITPVLFSLSPPFLSSRARKAAQGGRRADGGARAAAAAAASDGRQTADESVRRRLLRRVQSFDSRCFFFGRGERTEHPGGFIFRARTVVFGSRQVSDFCSSMRKVMPVCVCVCVRGSECMAHERADDMRFKVRGATRRVASQRTCDTIAVSRHAVTYRRLTPRFSFCCDCDARSTAGSSLDARQLLMSVPPQSMPPVPQFSASSPAAAALTPAPATAAATVSAGESGSQQSLCYCMSAMF